MDPRRHLQPASAALPEEVAGSHGLLGRILLVLLIVLSLCGISYFAVKAVSAARADSAIKSKQFQALFLTNGQVYFGKLSHIDSRYVQLTDIYYLQVSNAGSQTTVQPGSAANAQQQVSLAKLGNELHGPEDLMSVNRSQVLFWENLKDSGKVVQAINNYQKANPPKK